MPHPSTPTVGPPPGELLKLAERVRDLRHDRQRHPAPAERIQIRSGGYPAAGEEQRLQRPCTADERSQRCTRNRRVRNHTHRPCSEAVMRHSSRLPKNLHATCKQTLLTREYRNNLTQIPLISIFYRMPEAIVMSIFPISKPDAAFWVGAIYVRLGR